MNRSRRILVCSLVLLATTTLAFSQSAVKVAGSRGTVEFIDRNGMSFTPASRTPGEGDHVRTGTGGMAVLAIGPDITVTLAEKTEIEIHSLGALPELSLESGDLQLRSTSSAIRINSKYGGFSGEGFPLAMEVDVAKTSASIAVTSGAIKTQSLDASAVTFRAAESTMRTISAGGNPPRSVPAQESAPVLIEPVIRLGTPAGTKPPAPETER